VGRSLEGTLKVFYSYLRRPFLTWSLLLIVHRSIGRTALQIGFFLSNRFEDRRCAAFGYPFLVSKRRSRPLLPLIADNFPSFLKGGKALISFPHPLVACLQVSGGKDLELSRTRLCLSPCVLFIRATTTSFVSCGV